MGLLPGARIGGYEVLGLLGAGGMGEVYRGRDLRLQRSVAIKVITTGVTDPEVIKRFETEALSASALNHPNILTVHEFGVHEGLPYLVTELIEGETLRERLRRDPLSVVEALDIGVQMTSALEGAHALGIVHRDMKPENVMLRPDGYVKVLDFGLAKLMPAAAATGDDNKTVSLRTTPGVLLGTAGYMAPEQVRGQPLDERADVWSLGVILHEMVSGKSPFIAPTMSDTIASVLDREPPTLRGANPSVPPELERIVSKALAKDRSERYQTVRELLIDLRRLRRDVDRGPAEPVVQSVVAPAPRVSRAKLLLSVAGLLAAVAVGASVWFWMHPLRTVDFWLTVQRMRDGGEYQQPFESSGRETFEHGWKFKFNASSPIPGYLYLLNQGPATGGAPTLNLLYPMPSMRNGSASIGAGEQLSIPQSWYQFDENPGTEQFWIVWSVAEVALLEKAKRWVNATDGGHVKDIEEALAIQRLLETYAVDATTVKDGTVPRSMITGRGDVMTSRASLQHR